MSPYAPLNRNQIKAQWSISPQSHKSTQSHLSSLSTDFHKSYTIFISTCSSTAKIKSHLVESSHRFISTSNLYLEKRRLLPITSLFRTLHLSLVGIVPSSRSSEDVLSLLPRKGFALVESLLDDKLIRACLAFESIYRFGGISLATCGGSRRRYCEDVTAGGANWIEELVLCNSKTCVLGH